ncbi:putative toxin-antitoxin system toxin component, PIN family [Methylomonas albis]|uniref:Toxin-antitoxin system toxin component, PIN family n=1 Tax=Methylomonas albis TaxID=1854563 RepID=A0ABR9CZ22_9GAMM|nr:putative toxin-antitoxin system toxin component, PIN family [Methylomonas albis]MBD9355223.1 putative toxin-antitoxin system toxin component, PIN family [Methylomonas albis]
MQEQNNAPRVVIDTNLVLSALVFAQGRVTPLRRAWQNQQIQPLLSKTTAAELIRVLQYPKFKLSADDQQELLADYLPYCQIMNPPWPPFFKGGDFAGIAQVYSDLATAGEAQALITGDQDLLCLAAGFTCPILTAEQFLQTLNT